MSFESINYTLMLYSLLCILLGIFVSWFYIKKTVSSQSLEIETIQKSLNVLQQKYETLQMEKIEIDKQFAVLKQESQRIPEIEEELRFQQNKFSALQVLNATLEERLESKVMNPERK